MLAAVHHPNIVRLFGVSTDNVDRCCIVLEYAPLGCLRAVLEPSMAFDPRSTAFH